MRGMVIISNMKGDMTMTINMTNMADTIEGVSFTEKRSVSPDADGKSSGDKKTVNVKVVYDGLTLRDVFSKAFKSDVVAWQNGGSGRKNYVNIKAGSTIVVMAKAPGAGPTEDPMDRLIREAKELNISIEDHIKNELKKRLGN